MFFLFRGTVAGVAPNVNGYFPICMPCTFRRTRILNCLHSGSSRYHPNGARAANFPCRLVLPLARLLFYRGHTTELL